MKYVRSEVNNEMYKMTLKTARDRAGLTQIEAAAKIGVSVSTLGNYESGKRYPDVPTIRKIEEVYRVSYNQLIFLPSDYDLVVK